MAQRRTHNIGNIIALAEEEARRLRSEMWTLHQTVLAEILKEKKNI